MKRTLHLMVVAVLVAMSCNKEETPADDGSQGVKAEHGMIVLGEKLENPYTTVNMQKACDNLYKSRASRIEVPTTNLYVRFRPEDDSQFKKLENAGLLLVDHPLDYKIITDGDWYHDPEIPRDEITWQYAVVDKDFQGVGVEYEVLDKCCLTEYIPATRGYEDIDWNAVEREAYRLSGNEDRLEPQTRGESAQKPSGRITIVDKDANGGKPAGVSGVKIVCNSFVKFGTAYTDRDGYYNIGTEYSSDIRYRMMFKNKLGFCIGLNLILVPASVSNLGKESPEGLSMTITDSSDETLFHRCSVNNAAWEYFSRCASEDLDISTPPADTRIWLLNKLSASSAVMMHQGTVITEAQISKFLGDYATLVSVFAPDITIGTENHNTYRDLYCSTVHELSHASHFTKVGSEYWNKYILYIITSYISSGGVTYGSGNGENAGYCEVGEMWAYYMESLLYKDRYGGSFPSFGTSHWFYPQIFRSLDERGLKAADLLKALESSVTSRKLLREKLIALYPGKQTIIEDIFNRYI